MTPPPPAVHLSDLSLYSSTHHTHGSLFEATAFPIASLLGGSQLGARLVVVPAGKRAWPRHNHHANEEMFIILHGQALWRLGDASRTVEAHDIVLAPAGGPNTAHQLINMSPTDELRYLAISTMNSPDILEYPDSQKVGLISGSAPGGSKDTRTLTRFLSDGPHRGYWEDE